MVLPFFVQKFYQTRPSSTKNGLNREVEPIF